MPSGEVLWDPAGRSTGAVLEEILLLSCQALWDVPGGGAATVLDDLLVSSWEVI